MNDDGNAKKESYEYSVIYLDSFIEHGTVEITSSNETILNVGKPYYSKKRRKKI